MNDKGFKRVLLTHTGGRPNDSGGGALKIIYLLLLHRKSNLEYDFLSYDHFYKNIHDVDHLQQSPNIHGILQNFRRNLINNSNILSTLSLSKFYSELHLKKQRLRFNKYKNTHWDIIHSHSSLAMDYFQNNNAKKILSIHSKGEIAFDLKNSALQIKLSKHSINKLRIAERRAILDSNVITFPSKSAKRMFINDVGEELFTKKKIKIIYNGIDIDKIKNVKIDSTFKSRNNTRISFLNIANHIAPKNITKLVEVFDILVNQLKRKEYILYNIGWGTETEKIKDLIVKYKLENNFYLLGKLENNKTLQILKSVDYFISLGEKVVFDMVILEAIAAGKTVIASNIGGNKEVIDHMENGYLIDLDSSMHIAKYLNSLKKLDHIKIIKSSEKFSVQNMVNNYNSIYEQYSD